MKAFVQHRYGPPEVLALEEIERPAIADEDVLIQVRAVGLNAGDAFVMQGVPYFMRLFAGLRRPKHPVRGADVAGTVTAVGSRVTDLRPGDEVFGSDLLVAGGLAEYAKAPSRRVAPKPAGILFEQAAAIPIAGCTALQALRDKAQVQPGQTVLINGASGGVGTFAVQIAKALGARVTAVCSTTNVDLVRSLGADSVIDYTRDDFTKGTERFDVILDNVANHSLSELRRVLTPKGILVPNANTSGRWLGGMSRSIKALVMSPFVPERIRPFLAQVNQGDLLALTDLVEAGKVRPVIDRTYQLSQTADAMRHLESGHARGKVIVSV